MEHIIRPRVKIGVTITDEAFKILTERYGHPPTLGEMEEAVQDAWDKWLKQI